MVKSLNEDDAVDGILVQLPLPQHLEQKDILLSISPEKVSPVLVLWCY